MKKIVSLITMMLIFRYMMFAQVGINTDNSAPDASAILDTKSSTKGFLPPRVALTSANVAAPVTSPATGLLIYNTAVAGVEPNNVLAGYYYWNGIKWVPVSPPQGANNGDMLYWNGTQWVRVPVGLNGQVLTLNNGIPVWGGTQLAMIYTAPAIAITAVSATGGGTISGDGGSPVTERGICWNTAPAPATVNFKATAGSGPGAFTAGMTSLVPSTVYYVRAYAINSQGTSYGNEVTFTTQTGTVILTTTSVTSITAFTALSGGYISYDGGASVTARGVCWNTSPGPTTANFKTVNGSGTGSFSGSLTALSINTTYYVRAYATNAAGTFYGNEVSFTTQNGIATVTTLTITSIMAQSASGGGSVTGDGGSAVTAKGVCWSTSPGATINDPLTVNGSGTGTFSSSLTGLTATMTYYVRAYATNSTGTYYGNEVSFTTQNGIATVTTVTITSIMAQSASGGGSVTGDGGSAVTSKGVCWSTSPGPTINDPMTVSGSGTGTFSSNITGLNPSTLYYVRAYAVNGVGTYYGNEVSFTTQNGIILLTTTAASGIAWYTATSGGSITSDGGSSVTIRGVCWNTVPNPTTANSKTLDGTGTGSYTSSMTGLAMNTKYWIRAYATNNIGTQYGNEITIITKDCSVLTDARDGKSYNVVLLGSQCWMAQNLNYGSMVSGAIEQTSNSIPEKYCYDNISSNCDTWGGLYQWGEAVQYYNGASNTTSWNPAPTGNVTGICPADWHLPTNTEWDVLCATLGGTGVAGGKLKETGTIHWNSPNAGATNSSGFTALAGGIRHIDQNFIGMMNYNQFWTTTQNSDNAYYRSMNYNYEYVTSNMYWKTTGSSIRCIQN